MNTELNASLTRSLRRWKCLSLCLALAIIAGVMLGQAAQPGEPAQPRVLATRAPRPVLQPSDNVEATALAIAYDILRDGDTSKLPAGTVGGFAAEILNEFKAKRK